MFAESAARKTNASLSFAGRRRIRLKEKAAAIPNCVAGATGRDAAGLALAGRDRGSWRGVEQECDSLEERMCC
ncbi:hypothetical protein EV132_104127 [Rhizobium sullae]|uniref:Uncharacterized protein n=1 Tax=Rhizobium sullae TaxID=50338 RepID=A0A4R3Q8W0_RHISU|nr:hypothetical protein EV132_104127 [Rhizobium sullae]